MCLVVCAVAQVCCAGSRGKIMWESVVVYLDLATAKTSARDE